MIILSAHRFVSLRQHPLSQMDAHHRTISYWLKDPTTADSIFDQAARDMAALIHTPCWLVPIPSSTGSTRANAILAAHIARHAPGAQLANALRRTQPIESQCLRHRRNLPATPVDQHHLAATGRALGNRQVYFVDNVATSGHTLRAAFEALGQRGAGLVYAATAHILAGQHNDQPPLL